MYSGREDWINTRDNLIYALETLGFSEELGNEIVKNLGSPKAMDRMASYLRQVRPRSAELVVDEMLAIRSEIESWRERKAAQEANARYNEMRYYGFTESEKKL